MTDVKSWIELRREAINRRSEPGSDWTVDDAYQNFPRALDALSAVLAVLSPHYDYQLRREAKFGRKGSACMCDVCRAMEAIEGAINE